MKLTSMNVTQTLKNIGLAHHLIGLLKEMVCGVLDNAPTFIQMPVKTRL